MKTLHVRLVQATYVNTMMKVAFYDAKPYDEEFFNRQINGSELEFAYHDFRLRKSTAVTAKGADAACVFVNDEVDRACLEALSENGVRLVALRCAGFNNVDHHAAAEIGIAVVRVPAYSPHAVAEHAIALLSTLNRRLHRAYNRVRELNFSLNGLVGIDLHGKTIGIIGTGKIGKLTAQIFRGFGCRVLAYDLFPDEAWAVDFGIRYKELDEIYTECDVISLHTPLTPETHHMINKESVARMKKHPIIINTSRGKLIDTTAVISALKERKLRGVALDVYEIEEGVFFEDLSHDVLHDDELARLLTFNNVLITSHQGFLTEEALSEISRVTCENLICLKEGKGFLEGTLVGD
ncbi:MAG: 2-hydroxyacid dehydrogenase [Verrucomicrobiales bacterium]|nr:2-hydroxyacid dehydrogenase [Verrucomicrobiales bacterium]